MVEEGQPGDPLGSPQDGVSGVRQQLDTETEDWPSCVAFVHGITLLKFRSLSAK